MAEYKIFFRKSVWKDFKSILKDDVKNLLQCIESLSENPRQQGCKKLSGQERYRFRYGRYRIIYSIQDKELTVWIVKVGHRNKVSRQSEPVSKSDDGKACGEPAP